MIKHFVIKNFKSTRSSVEILKGYMLICRNAEGVQGLRKVGNPCSIWTGWQSQPSRRGRHCWKFY